MQACKVEKLSPISRWNCFRSSKKKVPWFPECPSGKLRETRLAIVRDLLEQGKLPMNSYRSIARQMTTVGWACWNRRKENIVKSNERAGFFFVSLDDHFLKIVIRWSIVTSSRNGNNVQRCSNSSFVRINRASRWNITVGHINNYESLKHSER